jgi:nicotinate-nucleotide pyrophosphorylase (carboxylating)
VTLANVRKIAAAGPDRISIGALTHSAPAADLSMDIVPIQRHTGRKK